MLEILQDLFEGTQIFSRPDSGEDTPLRAQVTASSDQQSKVCVLVGSNASGKSLGVKLLAGWLNAEKPKVEPIQVSMRYRTRGGIERAFMYGPLGDEQDSTGAVSLGVIQGALRTAKGRQSPCWVLLDEPDIGLSEDFTYALGEYLARNVQGGLGGHCRGLVLVTHSRALVRGLVENLPAAPHFVHVDAQPLDLHGWLVSQRRRTVEELENLPTFSIEQFRRLNKILKD